MHVRERALTCGVRMHARHTHPCTHAPMHRCTQTKGTLLGDGLVASVQKGASSPFGGSEATPYARQSEACTALAAVLS